MQRPDRAHVRNRGRQDGARRVGARGVQQDLPAPQAPLADQPRRDLGNAIVADGDDHGVGLREELRDLAARSDHLDRACAGPDAAGQLDLTPVQSDHGDAGASQADGQRGADDAGAHDEHRKRRLVGRHPRLRLVAGHLAQPFSR